MILEKLASLAPPPLISQSRGNTTAGELFGDRFSRRRRPDLARATGRPFQRQAGGRARGAGTLDPVTVASPPSANRIPASAQLLILGTTASGSPAVAARRTAAFTASAQAEGGAGIGSLSGGVTLPPDQPTAKASQV